MRAAPDRAMKLLQGLRVRTPAMRASTAAFVAALFAWFASGCNSMSGQLNNQAGIWNYEQGNYVAAREAFHRAAADDPRNPAFAHNLACAMKRQGALSLAERTYVQAIALDPTYQPAYHSLAHLMVEEGRQAEATQLVSTWVAGQPLHPGAQIEMAWLQRLNGDRLGAERSLFKALAIAPNDPIATAQLGQLYQEKGQTDRAIAMYERSLQARWMQPEVRERLIALENSGPWNAPSSVLAASPGRTVYDATPRTAVFGPSNTMPPPTPDTAGVPTNDDPAHVPLNGGPDDAVRG